MATLQELQIKLDNKTFDPSKLTKEQEAAVDLAFEGGQLTGYKNVGEVRRERDIGAKLVAKEKTERAQPFTTATQGIFGTDRGVERRDLELVGDVGGSLAVLMKDSPKVLAALRADPKIP